MTNNIKRKKEVEQLLFHIKTHSNRNNHSAAKLKRSKKLDHSYELNILLVKIHLKKKEKQSSLEITLYYYSFLFFQSL